MLRHLDRHALRQLLPKFFLCLRHNPFREERRELLLNLVRESEIQAPRLSRMQLAEDGHGLARVVVAVVIEENNLAADLLLQATRGNEFRIKEAPRQYSARLLPE